MNKRRIELDCWKAPEFDRAVKWLRKKSGLLVINNIGDGSRLF